MSFSKNLNLELKRAQKKLSLNLLYVLNIIQINLNGSFLQQHRISVGPQEAVQSRLGRRDSTREESSEVILSFYLYFFY